MKYWIVSKDDAISCGIREKLTEKIHFELNQANPDLIVVVGGDGTFISAVHQYPDAIFFGIHTGHLGFYANYTLDTLSELIEDINNETYHIEKVDVIDCELTTLEQKIFAFAINEMTIITPPKTLILDVNIDEQKLETFRGTGLCISTAYGSTAYNKSLFGAVVEPNLKAFQITEIAGINSNQYRTLSASLLLSQERTVTLEVKQPEEVFVTIDHLSYHLKNFCSAHIKLKPNKISLAHPKDISFVERIRRTFITE
ncbi:MAG: NAD kinase [Anaeroplasmataceae bacterium]|nr:NAD kinase [Anaeroplasmataceae bacterium]